VVYQDVKGGDFEGRGLSTIMDFDKHLSFVFEKYIKLAIVFKGAKIQ